MTNFILRLPEVKKRTGLARTTIYVKMAKGTFPKQLKLGTRTTGWLENEIEEWIEKHIAQRQLIEQRKLSFKTKF